MPRKDNSCELASGRLPRARAVGRALLSAAIAAGVVAGATGTAFAGRQPGSAGAGPATAYVLSINAGGDTSGKVTPVLAGTNKTLRPIVAKGVPAAIAITPDGKTAYIASFGGAVTPIRIATNTALAPIKIGGDLTAIAITP